MIHCFITSFPCPVKFRHEIIVVGDVQMFYTYICFVTGIDFDFTCEIGVIGLFIHASLYRNLSM